jgi:MarR family transcriptional regulator, lower aerobic nicotinate degradation pathway regulator
VKRSLNRSIPIAGSTASPVYPANNRRNIVSITREGKRQLRALDKVIDGIRERCLPLSEQERRKLMKLLRKLTDSE